jgi:ComF family protein
MALVDLLLPPACAGCGRYGVGLCGACRRSLRRASREADCFMTADPGIVVGDALQLGMAAFAYEGALRRALQQLKYGGAARLAEPLAQACQEDFVRLLALVGRAPLVPVPVHTSRLRQRGYNQAALLARSLARDHDLRVLDLLVRRRHTTEQHRLNRAGRLRNLQRAFALRDSVRPPPLVILVDDILTTSATLEACAAVLLAAGASRVAGFALAREL